MEGEQWVGVVTPSQVFHFSPSAIMHVINIYIYTCLCVSNELLDIR